MKVFLTSLRAFVIVEIADTYMDPVDSQQSPNQETPAVKHFFPNLFSHKKIVLPIAILLFVVLLAGLFLFIKQGKNYQNIMELRPKTQVKIAQATFFSVVSISPAEGSKNNAPDTPITITFSESVRPGSLHSYFTVSPMIPGTFSQGATPNQVVFKAKFPYGEGKSVQVILNKGFESVAGHKFTTDYTYNFFTKIPDNTVEFGNDNIYSRWLNLPIGKGTTFNIQTGNNVQNITVSVYKGTFDKIVSSLLYSNQSNEGSNYVTQTYINYPVDTSDMEQVSVKKNIQDGSYFDFNEGEGLYYVQAKNDDQVVGSMWVNVTNQGLIVRQDDQKVDIATQDITTGDTNAQVKVLLYNLQDKPTLLQVGNIQGSGEIPLPYSQKVDLIVGQTADGGVLLAPLTVPETQADIRVTNNLSTLAKIYVYTDKPTYKPGDTVKLSGILRIDNDQNYTFPPSGSSVHIWVPDPTDSTKNIIDQMVSVGDDGVFSGQFTLPTSLTPLQNTDTQSLTLYADIENPPSATNMSKSYTTFDVFFQNSDATINVTFDKDTYTKDETVTAHISGLDASGKPLAKKALTYGIYTKDYDESDPSSVASFGSDWGEETQAGDQSVTLDSNGRADIQIDQSKEIVSQAVTLLATATVNGQQVSGAKTLLVHQGNIILKFGPSRGEYQSGDTTVSRVYATDLSGNPIPNLPLQYEIYASTYNNSSRTYDETVLAKDTVQADSNGFMLISKAIKAAPGDITLRVTAKDSVGNMVQSERTMNIVAPNTDDSGIYYHDLILSNLDVATDKLAYNASDSAHLTINSPFNQNVWVTYERGRIYHQEWLMLHAGDNSYTIPITPQLAPSFNVVFSYFHNGSLVTEGLPISVNDPTKTLQVTTTLDKSTYVKTDTAQLTIHTADATGKPVQANIMVDVIDDSIFGLRNIMPSGDINWYYYSPRMITTNFSASTIGIGTGGGCGGGSGSDVQYIPNHLGNTIYWNTALSTDQNGQTTVSLPLTNSTGNLRVMIYAVTDTSAVGQLQSTIAVQ